MDLPKLLQATHSLESLELYFEGAHGSDVLERLASSSNVSYPELQSPRCDHATEPESSTMFLPDLFSLKLLGIREHLLSYWKPFLRVAT